jgi:hypothetical protein
LCVLNQSPRLKHQVSVSSQKRKGFNKWFYHHIILFLVKFG